MGENAEIENNSRYYSHVDITEGEEPATRPRRMSNKERKKRSRKRTCLLVSRVLLVFSIVLVYCLVGSSALYRLESPAEEQRFEEAARRETMIRNKIYQELLNISNDTEFSKNFTTEIIDEIVNATKEGSFQRQDRSWEFIQAFFFSATVITSIGFGNVSTSTVLGRCFVVAFAIFGLPLTVLFLANLGKLLSRIFKTCLKPLSKSLTLLVGGYICLLLFGLVFIIFLPAIVFTYVEEWSYWDALYFCFIALSTIGFGDVVVLMRDDRPDTRTKEVFYVLFIVLWLFVGLAYLALIIQEIVVLLSLIWKSIMKRVSWCKDTAEEEFEERPLEKLVHKAGKKVKKLRVSLQNHNLTSTLTRSIGIRREEMVQPSTLPSISVNNNPLLKPPDDVDGQSDTD